MNDALLFGWKRIAQFVGCSVDTVKRYHRQGMPLYRGPTGTWQGVPDDIVAWLRKKKTPAR